MRALLKRMIILAVAGFALGMLTGLAFLLPYGIGQFRADFGTGGLILHLLMGGVLGGVNVSTATIYSLERWGTLRCTLTHFLISMSALCLIGFSMHWFSLREPATLWVLVGCMVVYFIIWLVMAFCYKRRIRRINVALKRWKDAHKDA